MHHVEIEFSEKVVEDFINVITGVEFVGWSFLGRPKPLTIFFEGDPVQVRNMTMHCHNSFPLDLDDHKINWSRHRSSLYGCDRPPGLRVLKLGTKISN